MQKCKGSRDLLPQEMARFRHVEKVFRDSCLSCGYEEIRTPTLEYLHLFTSVGTLTPSMIGKVYSFLDWDGWSGQRVVLRPDATIPAARLCIENMREQQPVKIFYVENMFSFEDTGKQSRERWQCGAELLGDNSLSADAEQILIALDILKKLGISNIELRLSHAELLKSLLEGLGLSPEEQGQTLDQILDGNMEVLRKAVEDNPRFSSVVPLLFESKGKSPGFLKNVQASLGAIDPKIAPSLTDFIAITELLSAVDCQYEIDIASGKGFEYYTGIIFQLYLNGMKLGGGGRYNDLVPLLGGGIVPASGFALYMDDLIDIVASNELKESSYPKILVTSDTKGLEEWRLMIETARALRENGYIAETSQSDENSKDYAWMLRVQKGRETPNLSLKNSATGKKFDSSSITDVVNKIQEARGQ